MTDMNETQWWKKYVPGYEEDTSNIVFSTDNKGSGNTLDNKLKNALSGTELLEYWNELNEYRLKKQKQPKQKLSDVWTHIDFDPNTYKYQYKPNLSKLEKIASNADSAILEEIIDVVATVPSEVPYGNNDRDLHWRLYSIKRAIAENPNVSDCSIEKLKTFQDSFEDAIMCHKDCTEKDLMELAKTNATLEWKTIHKPKEGWGFQPIVGKLTMWGKIFMDPHASDELKQAIVEHSLNKNHNKWYEIEDRISDRARGIENEPTVLDYYLKRDDCPKEFFVPAVRDCMGEYFNSYIRNSEYSVDAERLNEIVAHPNMTAEAFEEALYIVREDMVEYAEDPEETQGHYRGRDDTCDLTMKDKQQIMQTMLKNPACTQEIAIDIFEAAKKTDLLEEVREFAQKEELFPEAEKQMEERLAKAARKDEIDNALARVHQKHEDLLNVKKAGDVELNKAVMQEKFADGDVLTHKVEGKTQLNKTIMKLAKLRRETQQK